MQSHKEEIVKVFRDHRNQMTLGLILCYPWGYEARARFTELRKEGYIITCQKAKDPSNNMYTLIPPEKNGQIRFA